MEKYATINQDIVLDDEDTLEGHYKKVFGLEYYYDYIDIYGKHIDLQADTYEEAAKEAQEHFVNECIMDRTCLLTDKITIIEYFFNDDGEKEIMRQVETVVEYDKDDYYVNDV